jgi:hypothetical protein
MSKLAKYSALATIIGTIFTIYVYYYDGTTIPIVHHSKESEKVKRSDKAEEKVDSYCEQLIKEVGQLPEAEISELRVRHKAANEIPSSTGQANALLGVVKICLKNQQFAYASEVAKDIPSSTTQAEAYRAISIVLAYSGQFENAINVAKKIPSSTIESIALAEIATIKRAPSKK